MAAIAAHHPNRHLHHRHHHHHHRRHHHQGSGSGSADAEGGLVLTDGDGGWQAVDGQCTVAVEARTGGGHGEAHRHARELEQETDARVGRLQKGEA
jgi:hypothetical protein